MKIVVLAGGTSTERTISIVSGTGICKALRQKGHQAVLADIFCGVENVDWEDPFPQEYDVDAASAYMSGFNDKIEEMKKAAEDFKKILKSKDITEIAEADVRFHDIIYMATDNQKLIQLLNNLREQMYRYRVEYLKREEAHPQLIAEHAAIIEYISKGEKKAATDIMCKHIDNQVTTVIDVIRTKQN